MTHKELTNDPREFPAWLRERANGHSPGYDIEVYARPSVWLALADAIEAAGGLARPASEYHEDMGAVLWWKFPIVEPPYFGDPRDLGHPVEVVVRHYENEGKVAETVHRHLVGGWPEYHTHFTTIALPSPPSIEKSGGEK